MPDGTVLDGELVGAVGKPGSATQGGWPVDRDIAAEMADEVAEAAAVFDVGLVLERRGDDIQER